MIAPVSALWSVPARARQMKIHKGQQEQQPVTIIRLQTGLVMVITKAAVLKWGRLSHGHAFSDSRHIFSVFPKQDLCHEVIP